MYMHYTLLVHVRVSTQKNEVFQNFSKLWWDEDILGLTLILTRGHAPTFSCRDIDRLIILRILAKSAKMWETIVIQYGERFLMLLLDEDDEFSEAVAMNRRLEYINHLARQFCQKTPNFCIST